MRNHELTRRVVLAGALATGSLVAVAVPSWSAAAGPVATQTVTSTTVVSSSSDKNYEVVDGIFSTKEKAQERIDALKAAKFKKFKIKDISPQFAVVRVKLTKDQATKLAKQINDAGGLGKARIKKLA